MTLLFDIEYFAPAIYYYKLSESSYCILDQYESYRKMSFRNRCTLSGANGRIYLSIPLSGGRGQRTLMKDVRILNSERWQDRHWKTITSVFNKSPWFEFYRDELQCLFEQRYEFLVDWNMACFRWVTDKMSIQTPVVLSNEPIAAGENGYVDWRQKLMPATIDSVVTNHPVYPQVFEERSGFLPNLSILDYLFCAGNKI